MRTLLIALILAFSSPAIARAQGPAISVYPVPGMDTATTETQITLRGAPMAALGTISVTAARSGRHAGVLKPHSDGQGASFVPDRRFQPGERVTVRTQLHIQGVAGGVYSFTVGRRPRLQPTRPGELPTVGYGNVQRYATRQDLVPPAVAISTRGGGRAPGLVFLAPKSGRGQDGPMIVNDAGQLVWFKPIGDRELATDFRVQSYLGKPVLTWWQGRLAGGDGRGEGVIYDEHYQPVRRVLAGNGLRADLHEFEITPRGTALLIVYDSVRRDLSSVGGPRDGIVSEAVVQEVDIATGLVEFEWHSLGDVALSESFASAPKGHERWDYLHLNSVALDAQGDFIVSSRAAHAVYKLSRATGRIVWRLGGRRSDFKLGPGASFALQHDARAQPDGTITLYDNSSPPPLRKHSRAIRLALDTQAHTATLVRALVHPLGLLSATQGSVQALPNGNTFVGWGSQRWFTEFDAQGRVVFDGRLARGNDTYRVFRLPWSGVPATLPKLIATRQSGRVTARVSWNGASTVARWELLGGMTPATLRPLANVPSAGFETALTASTAKAYVAVRALDAGGAVMATSKPLRPTAG